VILLIVPFYSNSHEIKNEKYINSNVLLMNYNILMNIPKYNKEEPSYVYFNKLRDFEYLLRKEKYEIAFNFIKEITDILNIKIKSLTDFKHIPIKDLIKNEKIIKLINSKHKEITNSLSISYNVDEDESINIHDFLNKILYSIGYKLTVKTMDEQKFYFITELK
jgi:hypothetical protein